VSFGNFFVDGIDDEGVDEPRSEFDGGDTESFSEALKHDGFLDDFHFDEHFTEFFSVFFCWASAC